MKIKKAKTTNKFIMFGMLVLLAAVGWLSLSLFVPSTVSADDADHGCKPDQYYIPEQGGIVSHPGKCVNKVDHPRNSGDCPSGYEYRETFGTKSCVADEVKPSDCNSDQYFVPARGGLVPQPAKCVNKADHPRNSGDCPPGSTYIPATSGVAAQPARCVSKSGDPKSADDCNSDQYFIPARGGVVSQPAKCVSKFENPKNQSDCNSKPGYVFQEASGGTVSQPDRCIKASSVADDDTEKAAEEACKDKSGAEKFACKSGFEAGSSGKSKSMCDSFSGNEKAECEKAFDKGKSGKDKQESGDKAKFDADPASTGNCSASEACSAIYGYITAAVNLLSAAVAVLVVAVIIFSGIQIASSSGNPEAIVAAKKHITAALIALLFFLFLWAFLNFLIPGGLFNGAPPS